MKNIFLSAIVAVSAFVSINAQAQSVKFQRLEGVAHGGAGHHHANLIVGYSQIEAHPTDGYVFKHYSPLTFNTDNASVVTLPTAQGMLPKIRVSTSLTNLGNFFDLPTPGNDLLIWHFNNNPAMVYAPGSYMVLVWVKYVAPNSYSLTVTQQACMAVGCTDIPTPYSSQFVQKGISAIDFLGIAPNPTYNTTNLTIKVAEAGDLNLSVLDVTGRTMATNNQYLMEGEQVIPIDLSNMPAGIYFVNWQMANGEKGTTKVSKK